MIPQGFQNITSPFSPHQVSAFTLSAPSSCFSYFRALQILFPLPGMLSTHSILESSPSSSLGQFLFSLLNSHTVLTLHWSCTHPALTLHWSCISHTKIQHAYNYLINCVVNYFISRDHICLVYCSISNA